MNLCAEFKATRIFLSGVMLHTCIRMIHDTNSIHGYISSQVFIAYLLKMYTNNVLFIIIIIIKLNINHDK